MSHSGFWQSRPARLLLLTMVVLACGDPSGPLADVASIEISGVPPDGVEVGASVQLEATPKDPVGRALSGAPVSWLSSDTLIGRVTAAGVVTGVAVGDVVIVATSGGKSATATIAVGPPAVASIALSGVPSEPVPTGSTVTLTATLYSAAGLVLTARSVWWSSSDAALARVRNGLVTTAGPGEVTITATSEGVTESGTLHIFDTVEAVSVSPTSGLLYEDQVVAFTATPLNALGNPVPGREVTWTSSAPAVASVDAGGQVTGVASGTGDIVATVEGVSGAAAVEVLERPVADWTAAPEWATHQGNARHTGHVPVTADPVVFEELWVRSLFDGTALNPVTAGAGKVFASTDAYFGTQRIAALDAATGAELWTYDFGGIHSVHPPAFGLDRVFVTTGGHSDSFLWSFDATSGAVVFFSPYGNQWSRYYAPVVSGDTVFMAGGEYSGMYAFSAVDGSQIWFAETNSYAQWTPAVANGKVYAYTGDYDPEVLIVDAATGARVDSIADPLFIWDGWSMRVSPALGDRQNLLATQAGRLLSFDLATLAVDWTRTAGFTGNVTVGNGVLYVFNDGQVEARGETDGELLWSWVPPTGAPVGTIIATRNLLFVSSASETYALDLGARAPTWSYPAGGYLALTREGILLIAQKDGTLAAIDVR